MHRIRVAEHLGASSQRPRHPQALDDEELFIIEGSPGAQRPDGRSAKEARKTGEKLLSHRHRQKVRNSRRPATVGTRLSPPRLATVEPARPTQQGHRPPFRCTATVKSLSVFCTVWTIGTCR